jgi:hypothetical protein
VLDVVDVAASSAHRDVYGCVQDIAERLAGFLVRRVKQG